MENLLTKLDLKDKQADLRNWDEAGLMYAMKYVKTMYHFGRKYVYKQSSGEKGVTTTLLCCTYASGISIPPMVIFRV